MGGPPAIAWLAAALALLASSSGAGAARPEGGSSGGPIHIGMVAALTGQFEAVGAGQLLGAQAAVKEVNRTGGVNGRMLALDLRDDGSSPVQGVIATQGFTADPDVVAMIGSGAGGSALASAPFATEARLPYVRMIPLSALAYPPRPYVFVTPPSSRLSAYALGSYLRRHGLKRIALLHDDSAFAAEGVKYVKELASRYGLLTVFDEIFSLPKTNFTDQLARVHDSDAQVLWVWDVAAAVAITKQYRQLGLSQKLVLSQGNATPLYLGPACPEANGAVLTSGLGAVAKYLPDSNPAKRVALKVVRLLGGDANEFSFNGYTGILLLAKDMRQGGASREGINRALEHMKLVGPEGVYHYSRVDHAGLPVSSTVVAQIKNCRLVPVPGQDLSGRPR